MHYDQIFAYLGQALIGPTLLLNFMSRVVAYRKEPCLVVNLMRKPVHPRDRTLLPMRLLRYVYFPLQYHKLMQRLNLLHFSVNAYQRALCEHAAYGYPMLTVSNVHFDAREDRQLEVGDVEHKLRDIEFKW